MSEHNTKQVRNFEPWEVLEDVLNYGEAIKLANRLHLSPQLIRAWRRPPESDEDFRNTGRKSCLERTSEIIDFIKLEDNKPDRAQPIAHYIARKCGGIFYPLPLVCSELDSEAVQHMSNVMKEVGEALEMFRVYWFEKTPGRITSDEMDLFNELKEAIAALVSFMNWAETKVER